MPDIRYGPRLKFYEHNCLATKEMRRLLLEANTNKLNHETRLICASFHQKNVSTKNVSPFNRKLSDVHLSITQTLFCRSTIVGCKQLPLVPQAGASLPSIQCGPSFLSGLGSRTGSQTSHRVQRYGISW